MGEGPSCLKQQTQSLYLRLTVAKELAVLMRQVTLSHRAGAAPTPVKVPAVLPTPPTLPTGPEQCATWLSGSISQLFIFIFLTFVSSNSWLLPPYGVLPMAAAQRDVAF